MITGVQASIVEIVDLSVRFGGILALQNVSLRIPTEVIYGLIGPNGAGKTTLLNAISGVFTPSEGDVRFLGRSIVGVPLHKRVAVGIARTFQGVELFPNLSVLDNIMLGQHHLMRRGIWSYGIFFGPGRKEEIARRRQAEEMIEFFELERYRKHPAGSLSYGIQKIVGLARAMCGQPRVLLLDEVAAGLNREEKQDLARFLLRLRASRAVTVLWVEHDLELIADLADCVAVLDFGRLVIAGETQVVLKDNAVRVLYSGAPAAVDE